MRTSMIQQENFVYDQDAALNHLIETYWDERSSDFSRLRLKELAGPCAAAWRGYLAEKLNTAESLKILDVGTGAGFFAILLGSLGHRVTGIDMSADMLHQAKQNVLAAGYRAEFHKMNAQELDFADDVFDVVISRNLTWTLPDATQAYREWRRVLKPGGRLLNFDSDYGLMTFSRKDDQADVHANIRQELVTECNDIKDELRISSHRRPGWDEEFLRSLGMQVTIEADIASRVRVDAAMKFDALPLFSIVASK
ncbi:Methyltransferase domain-containing protein [Selenomonas ruminantium]|uniref:Methyltransferase domain-containing protein n=1 Tax=Selenomonas ruminantium TaxID=971 RepID=A0A1M6U7M3_SELRU|nr:class I SAM-dependent methyltransferase [Selenomonas ruminantium]SHK65169.1 Methyltransferase domain-containing protein [Selenomonas ruminantium]